MSEDEVRGEVWFYTSYTDVFLPIDLSYEDVIRGLESTDGLIDLVNEIAEMFSRMMEREKTPKVRWAYLDLSEEEVVIRCRMEYREGSMFWSGDAYLFGLRTPSPTYSENIEHLSEILRRHRNILVLPEDMLRSLPSQKWESRPGVGIDRSYRD